MLKNCAARRFDWRKQAMSNPAKAISRGPACPVGTPGGKFAAGGATARADEPVLLIFGDDRLDFGEFPDLMAQRLEIDAGEWFAGTASRQPPHHLGLLGRDRMLDTIGIAMRAQEVADFQGSASVEVGHGSALRFLLGRCRGRHRRQQIEWTDHLLDALHTDVRVSARGPDRLMSQEGLQDDQVGSGVEKMRGEAVPQRMRCAFLGQSCIETRLLQRLAGSVAGQRYMIGLLSRPTNSGNKKAALRGGTGNIGTRQWRIRKGRRQPFSPNVKPSLLLAIPVRVLARRSQYL